MNFISQVPSTDLAQVGSELFIVSVHASSSKRKTIPSRTSGVEMQALSDGDGDVAEGAAPPGWFSYSESIILPQSES